MAGARPILIGEGLGLLLLFLRIGVYESGMFHNLRGPAMLHVEFFKPVYQREVFFKYIKCILIGVPIWYMVGILITFSPEFGAALGVAVTISAAKAVSYCYQGLVFGDFASGFLSQHYKSRRNIVLAFLALTALFIGIYLRLAAIMPWMASMRCAGAWLCRRGGYWAVFVTIAAEQFSAPIFGLQSPLRCQALCAVLGAAHHFL